MTSDMTLICSLYILIRIEVRGYVHVDKKYLDEIEKLEDKKTASGG